MAYAHIAVHTVRAMMPPFFSRRFLAISVLLLALSPFSLVAGFEGGEHKYLIDRAFSELCEIPEWASKFEQAGATCYPLGNSPPSEYVTFASVPGIRNTHMFEVKQSDGKYMTQVTLGDVTALGGDFWAASSDDAAICLGSTQVEQQRRFDALVEEHLSPKPPGFLRRLTYSALNVKIPSPLEELRAVVGKLSEEMKNSWGDGNLQYIDTDTFYGGNTEGSYVTAALVNFDHFDVYGHGPALAKKGLPTTCAQVAFEATYSRALESARNQDKDLAWLRLAWSLHFYTDTWAAGHMRTPRGAIYHWCSDRVSAGQLSRCAHNKDNLLGLWADVGSESNVMMLGDSQLNRPRAKRQVALLLVQVKRAIQDFVTCYLTPNKCIWQSTCQAAPKETAATSTSSSSQASSQSEAAASSSDSDSNLEIQSRMHASVSGAQCSDEFHTSLPIPRLAAHPPSPNPSPVVRETESGKVEVFDAQRDRWVDPKQCEFIRLLCTCVESALRCKSQEDKFKEAWKAIELQANGGKPNFDMGQEKDLASTPNMSELRPSAVDVWTDSNRDDVSLLALKQRASASQSLNSNNVNNNHKPSTNKNVLQPN